MLRPHVDHCMAIMGSGCTPTEGLFRCSPTVGRGYRKGRIPVLYILDLDLYLRNGRKTPHIVSTWHKMIWIITCEVGICLVRILLETFNGFLELQTMVDYKSKLPYIAKIEQVKVTPVETQSTVESSSFLNQEVASEGTPAKSQSLSWRPSLGGATTWPTTLQLVPDHHLKREALKNFRLRVR